MTGYEDRAERAAAETDFDSLPAATADVRDVSVVVSIRLHGGELDALERAAQAAGLPLSTFIRQAALDVARPLDVRAVSARAETIENEARQLRAMLRGKAS